MSAQSDENKKNTERFFEEVLNKGRVELIAQLLSPDYTFNDQPQSAAQNADWVGGLHKAFPGLHFTIEAILAEEDKVALRWRLNAPAANGRPAGLTRGTNIIVFAGGLAVSNRQNDGRTSPLSGY